MLKAPLTAALALMLALPVAAQDAASPAAGAAGAPAADAAAPAATTPAATTPAADPAARDAATVVATVNGQPITLGEVLVLREGLSDQVPADIDPQALWGLILDQLTRQEALAQGAADLTPRDTATLALQRRAYLATSVLEQVAMPEPDEEALRAAYAEAFGDFEPAKEYHAAHILVETEEAAAAVEAALAAGEDFAKVAEERSLDTSASNGGDLGWFTTDAMVAPFGQAVEALAEGQISAPVQTQFGWHVVKLIETRMQQPPAFEAVRDQLSMIVRRQRVEEAADAALAGAEIVPNPEAGPDLLSRTDLLGE